MHVIAGFVVGDICQTTLPMIGFAHRASACQILPDARPWPFTHVKYRILPLHMLLYSAKSNILGR